MRNDGKYTIYQVQCLHVGKTEHMKPNGPFKPYTSEWSAISSDHYGQYYSPWIKHNKRKNPELSDEMHDVRMTVGNCGFYDLKKAKKCMNILRKCNDERKLISDDSYGNITSTWNCEFRIAKVELSKNTEILVEEKFVSV